MRRVNGVSVSRLVVALTLWLPWLGPFPPSAAAQATRAEVIAREQEAKPVGTEGPSKLENTVVQVQRSPLIAGRSGFYPFAGGVYPGMGLGLGVGYLRRWGRETHLNLVAGGTVHGSMFLKASARAPLIAGGRLALAPDIRRIVAKNLSFYGLGPNSSRDFATLYDYRATQLGAAALFRPVRPFELSGRYERLILKTVDHAGYRASGAPPGLGTDLSYDVVEASAALDWRTSPGYSTRGGLQRVTWSRFLESRSRPFGFQQIEYEGIQLVPILREQFVLAGRALATLATAEVGDEVPVVLAPALGGGDTLRGFKTRRFTDRNRLLLTGEYRWRPSRFLDMAIFFDAGKVGRRRRDLKLSNLETDWGVGARFHGPAFVVLRTEIAKSREGWELSLAGGKAL
jgi:hypothetical protein